jgi:hypothetical protein
MRSDSMRSVHESRSNVNTPGYAPEIVHALVRAPSRSTAWKNSGDVVFASSHATTATAATTTRVLDQAGRGGLSTAQTGPVDRRSDPDANP